MHPIHDRNLPLEQEAFEVIKTMLDLIPDGHETVKFAIQDRLDFLTDRLKSLNDYIKELKQESQEKIIAQQKLIERACEAEGTLRKFPRDRDGLPVIPNEYYITTDGVECYPRFLVYWNVTVRQDERYRECTCQDVTRKIE